MTLAVTMQLLISLVFQILALATCKESEAASVLQCIMQASNKFQDGKSQQAPLEDVPVSTSAAAAPEAEAAAASLAEAQSD